jgi:cytochrome c oxidase subunit 2
MKELLGLPLDASTHGPQIDQMIVLLHWLMAFLFVVWGAYFVYALFRFRSSRNPKADYTGVRTHASSYLEVGVALFEGFLLIAFAIPVWSGVVTAYPDAEDAVVVHVVAEQFAWNVHYPGEDGLFGPRKIELVTQDNPLGLDRDDPAGKDDITTINQLTIPVGRNILIYLTSKDVIHSFGAPMLRVKQDAIPGQRVAVWFNATMTNEEVRASTAVP